LVEQYRNSQLPYWVTLKDENIISLDTPGVTPPVCPPAPNPDFTVVDGIKYTLFDANLTAEAAGLADSAMTALVIPASITAEGKSYQVESIGFMAFNNNFITSVSLPEGLKTIHEGAFGYTMKLEELTVPNSVDSLGPNTFSYCCAKKLVIGEGVRTIRHAYRNMPELRELYILAKQIPAIPYADIDMVDVSHWYQVKLYVPDHLVEAYRQSDLQYINEIKDENILPLSTSGIDSPSHRGEGQEAYYAPDGRRLPAPSKGLNIICRSDGTVKKVIVKH